MKTKLSIILLVFISTLFHSCSKDPEIYDNIDYSKYVTIKQGLWGSCKFREGNCMPGSDMQNGCKTYPVKRTIYIYQLASTSQVAPLGSNIFYTQINTTLIAQIQSDNIGFYQVPLHAGQYSILILEDGKYYCMDWGDPNVLAPVTIDSNATTRRDLMIDYKAVY